MDTHHAVKIVFQFHFAHSCTKIKDSAKLNLYLVSEHDLNHCIKLCKELVV